LSLIFAVPAIIYRGAVKVSGSRFDPAVVIDTVFETNGWGRSWRALSQGSAQGGRCGHPA